ncbi:MAG: hypothetical protein PHF33_08860 [Candidatus Delongbacteria bacterium]|nr:hypothetical protein [Candidatus Delongbacteria bacterium]
MTKEKITGLFKECGITEEQMMQFHKLFEAKYPADHKSFLEWLNIPANEVDNIRKMSK